MLELSQKLIQLSCQFLEPSLSNEVRLSTHNSDLGDIWESLISELCFVNIDDIFNS